MKGSVPSFLALVLSGFLACTAESEVAYSDSAPPASVGEVSMGYDTLTWTNPSDADFAGVVVLRSASSRFDSIPVPGTEYVEGRKLGQARIVYVGMAERYHETVFGDYCYVIYSFDTALNYSGALNPGACTSIQECLSWSRQSTGTVTSAIGNVGNEVIVNWDSDLLTAVLPPDNVKIVLSDGKHILNPSSVEATEAIFKEITPDGEWTASVSYFRYGCDDLSASSSPILVDVTPPGAVSDFVSIPANEEVILRWTAPEDLDLDKVVIRRSLNQAPPTSDEGDLVCEPCLSPYVDSGLTNEVEYSYSAWVYDIIGNESTAETINVTPFEPVFTEVFIARAADPEPTDQLGASVAISGDTALAGAPFKQGGASNPIYHSGAVYLYGRDGTGSWDEVQILRASDAQGGDRFGWSVAISGDTAIVGAPHESGGSGDPLRYSGAAYLFERDGTGSWNQVQIFRASDAQEYDLFGWSVAISGDTAIVGAKYENGGANEPYTLATAGAAYVFERDGIGTWNEAQILRASDGEAGDNLGSSVSISGDYAILGAEHEDGGRAHGQVGAAYVFERDGAGIWNEVQLLRASNSRRDGDKFASSVSISGEHAIIGARGVGRYGAAYIFKRDVVGNWTEIVSILATESQSTDNFGTSVSISGDVAIVGATSDEGWASNPLELSGAAYVFEHDGLGNWIEAPKLVASDAQEYDFFGSSVSISGDQVLVGAYGKSGDVGDPSNDAGAAYFFE